MFFRYWNRVEVVYCNDFNVMLVGYFLKKFLRNEVKIIYDCYEYEIECDGMFSFEKKILKFFERFFVNFVDFLLMVSDVIVGCYSEDYRIEKLCLVLNCLMLVDYRKNDVFCEILGICFN